MNNTTGVKLISRYKCNDINSSSYSNKCNMTLIAVIFVINLMGDKFNYRYKWNNINTSNDSNKCVTMYMDRYCHGE